MFKRNSNISQYSSGTLEQTSANDADFYSAASSPSNFMLTSTPSTSGGSMAKIIDIQKTKHFRRGQQQHQVTSRQNDEDKQTVKLHNRNAPIGGGTGASISGEGRNTKVPQATSANCQQVAPEAGGQSWNSQSGSETTNHQKQQSGETLSSFESDYDLLVYLGETETEDLVDTERSLDYQDQTWRQSICGGASLAPTIDESLSELIGHHSSQTGNEFDLLNTPTPFGPTNATPTSGSPFAAPSPARSLSSQQLSNTGKPSGTVNQQSISRAAIGGQPAWQAQNNSQSYSRQQQLVQPASSSATIRRPELADNFDECDSEVSSVFGHRNNLAAPAAAAPVRPADYLHDQQATVCGNRQTKRHRNNDEQDYANLPVNRWQQQPEQPNNNKLGNKLVSLFNRRPQGRSQQALPEQQGARVGGFRRPDAQAAESRRPSQLVDRAAKSRTLDATRVPLHDSDCLNSSAKLVGRDQSKSQSMGRSHEQQSSLATDELDRILAEMNRSLDLDALARFDTQPVLTSSFNNHQSQRFPDTSQTLGRFEPSNRLANRPNPLASDDNQWQHQQHGRSVGNQKLETPGERALKRLTNVTDRRQQQQASSESILDEYDGASRMLAQMISDQLEESAATRTKQQLPHERTKSEQQHQQQRANYQSKRADSLSQIVNNSNVENHAEICRDSPKSLKSAYNYPAAQRRPLQRGPTMGSRRSSKSSVVAATHLGGSTSSAAGNASCATDCNPIGANGGGGSRKVSTCSSSVTTEISVKGAKLKTSSMSNAKSAPTSRADLAAGSEPLERRSIWRAGGRRLSAAGRSRRNTSESSDNRKSIESSGGSQSGVRHLDAEGKRGSPPTPPAVDYHGDDRSSAGNTGTGVGLIRVEASELPPPTSSDEDDNDDGVIRTVPESQMDRMRRRTLSSYRSMRNKISDFMAGHDQAHRTRPVSKDRRSQTPAPPKRSSSIGSRSELPAGGNSHPEAPDGIPNRRERESRAQKRQARPTGAKGPSFGQQIRERLSRSKSRLSRLFRSDSEANRGNRSKSQPAKSEMDTGDASKGLPVTNNKKELLFEPGDLARNWTSAETRVQADFVAPSSALDSGSQGGAKSMGQTDDGITSPGDNVTSPIPRTSSNSSLSGLDISSSGRKARSASRRNRQPPSRASNNNNGSSRPTSLISLKRLSASFRGQSKGPRGDEDEAEEAAQGSNGGAKLSKRARRRRRQRTANKAANRQQSTSGSGSGHGSAADMSPMLAAKVATTDEYFGRVAPPRVDSPSPVAGEGAGELGQAPETGESAKRLAGKPIDLGDAKTSMADEPQRPNRSQSLKSVRLVVPQKLVAEAEDSHRAPRDRQTADESGQKRTVSFSNRRLPSTTNTFRPASACAQLEPSSGQQAMGQPEAGPEPLAMLVTPVGPSGNACSPSSMRLLDSEPVFRTPPPPDSFGQRPPARDQQLSVQQKPARSRSATILDDIHQKCANFLSSPATRRRRRAATPSPGSAAADAEHPIPRRPPRAGASGARVRSKSAMATDAPNYPAAGDEHGQVIEALAASPASSLGRSSAGAGSGRAPPRSKLSSFAHQLKLSAADFFQAGGPETRRQQPTSGQRPSSAAAREHPSGSRSPTAPLCEWRPVIAVRDAKLANRSAAGRSIVTGVLTNMGKDDDGESNGEIEKASLERRTAQSGISHTERLKQQQQRSLDTDSTWESSSSSDDNDCRDNNLAAAADSNPKANNSSPAHETSSGNLAIVQRDDGVGRDESSAQRLAGGSESPLPVPSPVAPADESRATEATAEIRATTADNVGDAGLATARDHDKDKARQVGEGFGACFGELNNNNSGSSANKYGNLDSAIASDAQAAPTTTTNGSDHNNRSELKRAKREPASKGKQLLEGEQQVAFELHGISKNFQQKTTTNNTVAADTSKTGAEIGRDEPNGVEIIGTNQLDAEKKNPDQRGVGSRLISEQRICKTPFRFNADLPLPSQVTSSSSNTKHHSSPKETRGEHEQQQQPGKGQEASKIPRISTNRGQVAAGTLSTQFASQGMVLDEADARLLEVLNHKRAPPSPESQKPQVSRDEQASEEEDSQKRLSIYENVPPSRQQIQTTDHQQQQPKPKRGWRKPPWPPEKPAHLSRAATSETSPPGSPSAWSVGDDVAGCLPKVPAEKLAQLQAALRDASQPPEAGAGGTKPAPSDGDQVRSPDQENGAPPAKPKRRLVTMTSIIQDPNDELMVAGAIPLPTKEDNSSSNTTGQQHRGHLQRRDSSISLADNGNGSDSDSSFAAAAANRHRLVSRFESRPQATGKPTPPARPKCPAFEDGKSALARGSPSGGGSLVKRLAMTFDQTASQGAPAGTASQATAAGRKPPVQVGARTQVRLYQPDASGGQSSFELSDEPKSESTVCWYDAKSSEQLDELEVAKFLAEFDTDGRNQSTLSEEVSTGADPFVTVADSTLEEPRRADEADEDDTLNDEVGDGDDLIEEEGEVFGPGGDLEQGSGSEQQHQPQGKDTEETKRLTTLSPDDPDPETASVERSRLASGGKLDPVSGNSERHEDLVREFCKTTGERIVARQVATGLGGGDQPIAALDVATATIANNTKNNNSNDNSEALFAEGDDNCASGSCATRAQSDGLSLESESASTSSTKNAPVSQAPTSPAAATKFDIVAPSASTVAQNAVNNPTIAADTHLNNNNVVFDTISSISINAIPSIAATTIDNNADKTQPNGVQLIDQTFKNSLNHIIARRSSTRMAIGGSEPPDSSQGATCDNQKTMPAEACSSSQPLSGQQGEAAKKGKTVPKKKAAKTEKAPSASEALVVSSKELKGLTRYYHALLGRRSRPSNKSSKTSAASGKQSSQHVENLTHSASAISLAATKSSAQIDDCIHSSSSSSSSASSSLSPSPSCSRSSSPLSSRSQSPIFSANNSSCSSAAHSDDDGHTSGPDTVGRKRHGSQLSQVDDKKLIRDAKKCSHLYEELQKILANRLAKQQHKHSRTRRPQSQTSTELDPQWQQQQQNQRDSASEQLQVSQTKVPENPPAAAAAESEQQEAEDYVDFYSWSLCNNVASSAERDDQISLSSSSVSSESIPEIKQRQNLQKLYHIVNEIHSSEAKFVDTLRLLNEDFRRHMGNTTAGPGNGNGTVASNHATNECVASLLKHLPQLQALNENLLEELRQARDQWPKTRKIAHVLVKIGPFLKHYSTYIREFDSLQQQFVESLKKYPHFAERVREFEASDKCQKLTIQHHLLRPIQRIPQYRLLLQQYLHHLKPDDVDYEDTVNALEVVSRVAEHANQSMNEGANFAKLLALQAKIVGKQRDIVQPGRLFVKEGELLKVCRKQVQPRWFVLLNDALLYLTQIQSSDILYLNNELPLDDCLISTPNEIKQNSNLIGQQFETEFSVCTKTRSFALIAKSRAERDDWVATFRKTIDEYLARRRSFSIRQQQQFTGELSLSSPLMAKTMSEPQMLYEQKVEQQQQQQGHLLGQKAPLWTPDSRVSMCQLCTSSFSALFRRHHCRACGRVVCSACSSNKAPLVYLKCRSARVCDQCFEQLKSNIQVYYLGGNQKPPALGGSNEQELRQLDEHFRTLLKSQFVRHAGLKGLRLANRAASGGLDGAGGGRQSGRGAKGWRSERLGANDSGSTISGYLHRRHQTKPKWKRQWFVIRDKVLYVYRAIDDVAAVSSTPLLGFTVDQPPESVDGLEPKSLIRLRHLSDYARCSPPLPPSTQQAQIGSQLSPAAQQNHALNRKSSKGKADEQPPVIEHLFKAESVGAAERWLEAFKLSVVLDGSCSGSQHIPPINQ